MFLRGILAFPIHLEEKHYRNCENNVELERCETRNHFSSKKSDLVCDILNSFLSFFFFGDVLSVFCNYLQTLLQLYLKLKLSYFV